MPGPRPTLPGVLFAWALLAQGAAPACGQVAETPSDIISTAFAWPVGVQATVQSVKRRVRSGEPDQILKTTYRMTVEGHDGGLLIRHDQLTVGGQASAELSEALGFEPEPAYDLVVDDEGMFAAAPGVGASVARFRRAFQPLLDSLVAAGVEPPEFLLAGMSEEYVTARVADQWAGMVETWAWYDWRLGETTVVETDLPTPIAPDETVRAELSYSAVARVPCRPGEEPRCVRFKLVSRHDGEQLKNLMQRFFEDLRRGDSRSDGLRETELEVSFVESLQQIVVVAEPETMLPHRFESLSKQSFELVTDGASEPMERIDETILTFTYLVGGP